ncbi:Adhesin YadA precursor, partial [Haemophilus influenzae]
MDHIFGNYILLQSTPSIIF